MHLPRVLFVTITRLTDTYIHNSFVDVSFPVSPDVSQWHCQSERA